MKKLLTALLAVAMIFSIASVSALALNEEDYDNQYIFSIKEDTSVLWPGTDYYFDCEWQGGPITDDFFEFYSVSVSVSRADDDNVSSSTAKKIVEKAEFVKLNDSDKYYFHFRAKANYSYADDAEVHITVLAKDNSRDKDREDSRSWYEMDIEIGYYDKEVTEIVDSSQYDVDPDSPIVEFDEELKSCRLDFEDGSYYNIRLARVKKFNLGYNTTENTAITRAYPNASFKFISFYAHPSFAYESVLKIKAPETTKYLYQIGDDNSLTLVADVNNNGYFGHTTSRLGTYVASSVPLDANKISVGGGNFVNAGKNVSQTVSDNTASSTSTGSSSATTTQPSTQTPALVNPPTGAAA
ncbi:hypothetical protein ACS3UN_03885 [Oscillospiraceae bacterium LTW-04]|nr:hypothetical protein RBH76_06580 [Oscillospiraceae bacterium MB24-C1]